MEAHKICLFVPLPHVLGSLLIPRTVVVSDMCVYICVCVYTHMSGYACMCLCGCLFKNMIQDQATPFDTDEKKFISRRNLILSVAEELREQTFCKICKAFALRNHLYAPTASWGGGVTRSLASELDSLRLSCRSWGQPVQQ